MNYRYIYVDGRHYKRVNKTKARNLYNAGTELLIYPINANPSSHWVQGHEVNMSDIDEKDEYPPTFDSIINRFEYYNCNSELGRYTKFYIMIQDNRRAQK